MATYRVTASFHILLCSVQQGLHPGAWRNNMMRCVCLFSMVCMICGICAFATHDLFLESLLVIGRVLSSAVKRFKLCRFSFPVLVSFLSGAGGATAMPSWSNARQRVVSEFWIWSWPHILCAEDIVHRSFQKSTITSVQDWLKQPL